MSVQFTVFFIKEILKLKVIRFIVRGLGAVGVKYQVYYDPSNNKIYSLVICKLVKNKNMYTMYTLNHKVSYVKSQGLMVSHIIKERRDNISY